MKIIDGNDEVQKASTSTRDIASDKSMDDIVEFMEGMEAEGKGKVLWVGNLDDAAKMPPEKLPSVLRKALIAMGKYQG